ncbi:MAG: hypothetical protein JKY65_23965, partial [Planctomycetes bacterium]|nr:hypothetical protein [Planctomycetota bacterium]
TLGARTALGAVDSPQARLAIASEVSAWALGYPDPLLTRAAARSLAGTDGICCGYAIPHSEHVELIEPTLRTRRGWSKLTRLVGQNRAALSSVLEGRSWLVLEPGRTGLARGALLDELEWRKVHGRPGFEAATHAGAIEALLEAGGREEFISRRLPDLRELPDRSIAAATTRLVERNERLGKLLSLHAPELILRNERRELQLAAARLEERLVPGKE